MTFLCRLYRAAVVCAAFLTVTLRCVAQDVDVKGLQGVPGALIFSKDGRWLREFESISLIPSERSTRIVTYDTKTGRVVHVLLFGKNSQFGSATSDGRIALIWFNRNVDSAAPYNLRVEVDTGRQEEIPAEWLDNDPNAYATISGDGRIIGVYTELGPQDGPRIVRLYGWRTKKKIAQQSTGFPAGGFAEGEVTADGKILFQTNRTGGEVVEPKTGRTMVRVSPNTYRSPNGAWDIDFPNSMYDEEQETTITDGITGIVAGKLEGSGGNNTAAWTWSRGAFCGNSGRFVVARVGAIEVFEIPSGKKIADFPAETWRGELGRDVDAPAIVGCSADGKLVAARSVARLTIHRLP